MILVEPQERLVRLIRTIIETSFAAEVVVVDDPEQLRSTLAQMRPSLVIVDVASRQYHGFGVPRQIERSQATEAIPFIALGTVSGQAEIVRVAGFSGSIPFPFSVRDFVEGVRPFLHQSS